MKYDPQFLTEIVITYLQPVEQSLKQTFLFTLPSSTVGEHQPTNLTSLHHICMLAHALLAFLYQQPPQNDSFPEGVGCHTTLNRKLLCNLSFYYHNSGFYNGSSDVF